jgi:hypothetical protein
MSTREYFNFDGGDPEGEQVQITMTVERSFQKLIEAAGGRFVCIKDGSIIFMPGPGENETPISLYPHALRSTADVRLAIKSVREKQKAAQWEMSEPSGVPHAG